jgi:hypothetical protein
LSVQLAAMVAAIPMPAISPAEINARNATLLRQDPMRQSKRCFEK